MSYYIIKTEYKYSGEKISEEEIKTVCSEDEAKRLLETVFRSDSFTRYSYKEKRS